MSLVFNENGRRRKGERAKCKHCHASFVRRAATCRGKKKIYCSTSCAQKGAMVRREVECAMCKKDMLINETRASRSKSGLFFCSLDCKFKSQNLNSGVTGVHPAHYGTGENYKKIAFDNLPNKCADCDCWFLPVLVVHHKDGDRQNNDVSNLEIVCQNHHSIRHMKKVKGMWCYCSSALTPREKIGEILAEMQQLVGIKVMV